MKILAVDDDAFILELIPMIAAKVGFQDVSTVLSGELALETLENADVVFDCLLFDIQMPGMDGIELCRQVRTITAYRETPIIMLTAMTERDYIEQAFKAGATDYATKPFDITELGARLRIAQELVKTRQEAAANNEGEELSSTTRDDHKFKLSDEVQIEGIKDIVAYTALGNYLAQLSRAGMVSSQVIAVKIDRIDVIYAKASSEEFLYALTEVAAVVGEIFRTNGYLMAYAGNGVFVVISNAASLPPSIDMEKEMQSLLDERNSEYDNGEPLDIEVSVGNPIRPSSSETHLIRKAFDRAIARAENRVILKRNEPRPLGIRMNAG